MDSIQSFNIGSLSISQLIDHLQNAVMEEDIIYTVFWLRALGKRGVEDGAVKLHSWRMTSALSTICARSHTNSRLFILQILLSKTSKRTLESEQGKIALEASKEWSRWIVSGWESGGKEQGQDAVKLLQMRSKKAEEWINKNLPPHPNPGSLTRRSALPGPPGVSRTSATPSSLPAPLPLPPLESQISTLTAQARLDETVLPSPIRLYITGFSHDIPAATFHEFAADSGVDLYDTYIVRMTRDNAMICTVSTKVHMDRLIEIVEKPWDPDIRVQLALPRDVHLAHYHVRVRGLSQNVRPQTLHRWAKRSRCAPFDAQVGRLNEEYVGLFRVETEWGAKEACRLLSEATAEHPPLIATWGKGRGPVLEPPSNLPSHLPAKPLTNHAKASYSRPLFPEPPALSSRNATPLDTSTSIDPSLVSHSRCSSPPIHTPSIIVKSCSPLPLPPFSLPTQLPSNEECDMEISISSSNSQPDIEPSQSSPSPHVTPSISMETISTSPEPLPFALPQAKSVSPPFIKALPFIPPVSASAQIVERSHETFTSSLSSSSTGTVPILDERVEFANLVAKRLVEGVNIGESFLFSSSQKDEPDLAPTVEAEETKQSRSCLIC